MYDDYRASEEDLNTIEEGISYVWRQELDYIFADKKRVENTAVISYDSKYIYIFGYKKSLEKIPHKIIIPEEAFYGWRSSINLKEFLSYLPPEIVNTPRHVLPKISGPLLTPALNTQKERKRPFNAYTTKESYLATIVHEFGHIYHDSYNLWYYSDLERNLRYMGVALDLFKNSKSALTEAIEVALPANSGQSEIFAFCTDYSASNLFWPSHVADLDKMHAYSINEAIENEKKLNLYFEDSYLSENRRHGQHLQAAVMGRILYSKYPKDWPERLLKEYTI